MAQLWFCALLIVLLPTQLFHVHSLSITSLYVIVDPVSTTNTLVFQLKDHYTENKQRVGYMNDYLLHVYIKDTATNAWRIMQNDGYNYMLYSNETLITPISLRLTFVEDPLTNYSWNSFLSNFEGTTIYHLYIEKPTASPTTPPTDIPIHISTATPTQTSVNNSQTVHSNALAATQQSYDASAQHHNDTIFGFDPLLVSLVLVCLVCVIIFVCCVAVCCCFYLYFQQRIQSVHNPKNQTRKSIHCGVSHGPKHPILPPKFIKVDTIMEDAEGRDESIEMLHSESSCLQSFNDHDGSNAALFRNISSALKKVTSVSLLKKLSKSNSYDENKDRESDPIVVSTDLESKSRTSISLHSAQPGLHPSRTCSLNMDQLMQLQHGVTVETGEGIRVKLNSEQKREVDIDQNSRKRVLSLIKTYDTNGRTYKHINGLSNDDTTEEELSSSSNESLYNYHEQTDGGSQTTTPTAVSNINCEIDLDQLASLPLEEGVIASTDD
eukprot:475815_1